MNIQHSTPSNSSTELTPIIKKCDSKFFPVWSHFTSYAKKAGDYYNGACNFCEFKISTATVSSFEEHLTNVCLKVSEDVRLEYLKKRADDIEDTYLMPECQSSIERIIV
ncbi:12303_t:CDS:2, partial [Funneliformis caledonium]